MQPLIDTILQKPGFRVSILGAGRSGVAAARYFLNREVPVFISDTCSLETCAEVMSRNKLDGADWEAGGHTDRVLDASCIILSPGIPSDIPVLTTARARGIPVWSEMELGFLASRAPFLAVTGSTGKSTTVSLAGAVLKAGGREHVVAGNIGIPVITATPSISDNGFVVAEVSSFQLETIESFHPRAAVILNFMKNHLDRYSSEEAYYAAKKAIVKNCGKEDYLIVNALDEKLVSWAAPLRNRMRLVVFGADREGIDSFWIEGTTLCYRFDNGVGTVGDLAAMKLKGLHNYHNAAVAAALGMIAGVKTEAIMQGLCSFTGLPHRLEFVAEQSGCAWYNDSKSTTAESIVCAVEAFDNGVVLIAGGRDKGCDFSVVRNSLQKRVRQVLLIGEAAERMEREWTPVVPVTRCATLSDAVSKAAECAVTGNAVVFSPGCSSFDMFRNYEDRGESFRKCVTACKSGTGTKVATNE